MTFVCLISMGTCTPEGIKARRTMRDANTILTVLDILYSAQHGNQHKDAFA